MKDINDDINQTGSSLSAQSVLSTERLELRPIKIEDASWIARESGRWDVARHLAQVPVPNSVLGVELFIMCAHVRETRFGGMIRAIMRKTDQTPIGVMAAPRKSETGYGLGYWFTPDAWGQGYATEAGLAMIQALKTQGAERFDTGCFKGNPASARVLEKLGFEQNGTTSQEFCMAHMKNLDHIDMSLRV